MVGKAIHNYIVKKDILTLIILVGSVLFMVSDLALLFYNFASRSVITSVLCLGTYYPAQAILGFAMFYAGKEN